MSESALQSVSLEKQPQRIKVYCRIRPSANPSGYFSIDGSQGEVSWNLPPAATSDVINNSKTFHKFKFDGVLDDKCDQEVVFTTLAREAVDTVLAGVNATIFAYGQTGSGKTFTMTGGPEKYSDRGLIPRAVSRLFGAVHSANNSGSDVKYETSISYMEIYNETAYDLLDPEHEGRALEELPRVTLQEDDEGRVHPRGLSRRPAQTEAEALNLLFLGDTNRAIAETPMNMASSRSHCIFTVSLEARQVGTAIIRKSKLNLVDLAGSERVHKTHATGVVFREAAHINKSLHYLEMVIVALHEVAKSGRSHIPYRNSIMTSVLRDSLGGNCVTSMVATLNPESEHTDESLSTCRFAQRVARVTNIATVNEEVEPRELIRVLRARVGELEAEVSYLVQNGVNVADKPSSPEAANTTPHITQAECDELSRLARAWAATDSHDSTFSFPPVPWTLPRVKFAMHALRDVARAALSQLKSLQRTNELPSGHLDFIMQGAHAGSTSGSLAGTLVVPSGDGNSYNSTNPLDQGESHEMTLRARIAELTQQLQARDAELASISNMIRASQLSLPPMILKISGGESKGGALDGPECKSHSAAGLTATSASSSRMTIGSNKTEITGENVETTIHEFHDAEQRCIQSTDAQQKVEGDDAAGHANGPNVVDHRRHSENSCLQSDHYGWDYSHEEHPSASIRLPNGDYADLSELSNRTVAMNIFEGSHSSFEILEECSARLRIRYTEATAAAEHAASCRNETARLRASLERRRIELAVSNIVAGKIPQLDSRGRETSGASSTLNGASTTSRTHDSNLSGRPRPGSAMSDTDANSNIAVSASPDATEARLIAELRDAIAADKVALATLRSLRSEVEELQRTIANTREEILADFETWWSNVCTARETAAASRVTIAQVQDESLVASALASSIQQKVTDEAKSAQSHHGVALTGDPSTDADIVAFLQAREALMQTRTSTTTRQVVKPSRD